MSYLFLANASLEITTAAGASVVQAVKVRFYKSVPKRAATGLITIDGGNATEFRLTKGAGLGTAERFYMYFMYGDRTAYVEITSDMYAASTGSTVKLTTEQAAAPAEQAAPAAPAAAPADAPAETPAEQPVKAERKARRVKA